MKIYVNQKNINDINKLTEDPAVENAVSLWSKEDIYRKSAIDLSIFNSPFGSISLLYGPRQIGKTASLKLFLHQLKDSETMILTDCSAIVNRADLYEHLSQLIQGKTTIVLDEIQEIEGWHLALRSLYSEGLLKNCRVWCTGSEARHLLESGERLPGRKGQGITVFARPWSFREFMNFLHPDEVKSLKSINYKHINQRWLDDQKLNLSDHWQTYLKTGGIPQTIAEYAVNQNIPDTIWHVYMDWLLGTWSKLRTPERSLAAVARRICETLNSRVSHETIKKGTDIQSANTIKALLEMQEDHFAINLLPRFDIQKMKFLPSKLKKIYPLDPYIARVWSAIGYSVKRLFDEKLPILHLDECGFFTQTYRWVEKKEASYLYNDSTKSEIDFYFDDCGFELKSNGKPTKNQFALLRQCPQAFYLTKEKLPIMAYLLGEGREIINSQA